MREITQEPLFDLRWLAKRYYKKKGFVPLDISYWPPYTNKPSIKKVLGKNTLFLKNSKDALTGIVVIRDWKRIVGVNQGYHVEQLKDILKKENIELNGLRFILVSRRGFSESIESFAIKHKIELKSERDMCYEYPGLGEFLRKLRKKMENEKELEMENKNEKEDVATPPEGNSEDIQFSHPEDVQDDSLF